MHMGALFPTQRSEAIRWVRTMLWLYFGLFIFIKVTTIWFGSHLLVEGFCLRPRCLFEFQWWRCFSYSFLHVDFWHLFFNMLLFYGLAIFLLEYELSIKKFIVLYALGILGGGLIWCLLHLNKPYYTLIGASAGIATLLTYFCCLYPEKTLTLLLFFVIPMQLKARWCFYFFALYEIINCLFYELSGMTSIAHSAHLGGMMIGFLATKYQCYTEGRPKRRMPDKRTYCVHYESHNVIKDIPFDLLDKVEKQGLDALSEAERQWLEAYRK